MKRPPKIIGLTGYAGAGKNEAALADPSFASIAFADAVRREVIAAINLEQMPPELLHFPRQLDAWDNVTPDEVWAKPTTPNMRALLQWWGTEYRRAKDPLYWVRRVAHAIEPERDYFITDVRFPNEVALVRALGGVIVRIERGAPVNGHISERTIDEIHPDVVIRNNGSVAELHAAMRKVLQSVGDCGQVPTFVSKEKAA